MNSDLDYTAVASATAERIEQLKAMEDFPVAKGAAMALIRLTQRESTSLAVLAHAIKADPTFSVRLIKVANGASGSEHPPVVSLRDAVSVLGVPAVRALALGFSLLSNYRSGLCASFPYRRFWSHSLARAVALQLLTGAIQSSEAEEAFSVGLLARIGELALAELFPEQYADILEQSDQKSKGRPVDLEQLAFAITHPALTASILGDCGLPADYVESAENFETCQQQGLQEGSGQFITRHSLALADHIGDICLAPQAQWRTLMPKLFQLGSCLSLTAKTLIPLCDRIAHEWREWGAMLEVDVGPMPRFEECAAEPERVAEPESAAVLARVGTRQRICILVVGDQERLRNPLCSALTEAGHEVFEAADGRQAQAMAIDLQPQLVLVEGEDGIELTRTLRQSKLGRSIYILIVIGAEDDAMLVQAFAAGVDDFLSLPLQPRELAARLCAGQRVIRLQEALAHDQEEIRRISADLSVMNQQLREVGMTDMLTGCPNRRSAMDRIQQEWAMAARSQRPLACMVIDLDNFTQINDVHGHGAGDTVLKLVASALKDEMRAQDILARTGGDEFLVICPDTTLEAAAACAERIRVVVENLPIVCGQQNVRGSVSVGVAVRDASTSDPDALLRLADQGAYLAKRRRNAVVTVQATGPAAASTQ